MFELVTDEELARARHDPDFRQQLMKQNLDMLLEALNKARKSHDSAPVTPGQIKEGADLAVKLADRLRAGAAETEAA